MPNPAAAHACAEDVLTSFILSRLEALASNEVLKEALGYAGERLNQLRTKTCFCLDDFHGERAPQYGVSAAASQASLVAVRSSRSHSRGGERVRVAAAHVPGG